MKLLAIVFIFIAVARSQVTAATAFTCDASCSLGLDITNPTAAITKLQTCFGITCATPLNILSCFPTNIGLEASCSGKALILDPATLGLVSTLTPLSFDIQTDAELQIVASATVSDIVASAGIISVAASADVTATSLTVEGAATLRNAGAALSTFTTQTIDVVAAGILQLSANVDLFVESTASIEGSLNVDGSLIVGSTTVSGAGSISFSGGSSLKIEGSEVSISPSISLGGPAVIAGLSVDQNVNFAGSLTVVPSAAAAVVQIEGDILVNLLEISELSGNVDILAGASLLVKKSLQFNNEAVTLSGLGSLVVDANAKLEVLGQQVVANVETTINVDSTLELTGATAVFEAQNGFTCAAGADISLIGDSTIKFSGSATLNCNVDGIGHIIFDSYVTAKRQLSTYTLPAVGSISLTDILVTGTASVSVPDVLQLINADVTVDSNGNFVISAAGVTIQGTFTVSDSGAVTITGDVVVDALQLSATGSITVKIDAAVPSASVTVAGAATIGGDLVIDTTGFNFNVDASGAIKFLEAASITGSFSTCVTLSGEGCNVVVEDCGANDCAKVYRSTSVQTTTGSTTTTSQNSQETSSASTLAVCVFMLLALILAF